MANIEDLFLTDEDVAYYEEVNRKCAEMLIELEVIGKRIEDDLATIEVLRERLEKVGAEIDKLYEGRIYER